MCDIQNIIIDRWLISGEKIRNIGKKIRSDYVLLQTGTSIRWGEFALKRMLSLAVDTQAGFIYADYWEEKKDSRVLHPLIDYQAGSLRDDFDFGPVVLIKSEFFKKAASQVAPDLRYAGWYELRLAISEYTSILHINEPLYSSYEPECVDAEEKQFAYVDSNNRNIQLEMEAVCTAYLKRIHAFLKPVFKPVDFDIVAFDQEASVIIPVRNRAKTIEDAIRSVLSQQTTFPFNLIIVDNHSSDDTTEIIRQYSQDRRVVHLIPPSYDLNIGGCWNYAVHHSACGKFAVQLDSDDLYAHSRVLETIINAFYQQQCAIIIGTYKMVDFKLKMIPPGIIEHKEWTPENGRNNALRINGLGAPRAFYTPVLREFNLPNTGYGEDYAIGLRISREYQIGRIYDVMYLCRRWEGNSDAAIALEKANAFNVYKDRIRTWELQARQRLNQ